MNSDRLLAADAHLIGLEPLELSVDDVLSGAPTAGLLPLAELGSSEIGLWELTSGTVRDVEADEVFIVLAGDATVRFDDGTAIELRPGVVCRLHAGDRTEWEVRSTLRKVYVTG